MRWLSFVMAVALSACSDGDDRSVQPPVGRRAPVPDLWDVAAIHASPYGRVGVVYRTSDMPLPAGRVRREVAVVTASSSVRVALLIDCAAHESVAQVAENASVIPEGEIANYAMMALGSGCGRTPSGAAAPLARLVYGIRNARP